MNYDEIKLAAKNYADRQGVEVTENMDTFILMAEGRINRLLKTRMQSNRAYTYTIDEVEYYPLPLDYAGMRDVQVNSALPFEPHSTYPMTALNPQMFNSERGRPFNGTYFYCIIADQIQIHPILPSGQSIEMVYFQKVPALNESAPSNWLSEAYPDIYVAGVTSEIEGFVKNYDVSTMWQARMAGAIDELDMSDTEERWSGAPLTIRIG